MVEDIKEITLPWILTGSSTSKSDCVKSFYSDNRDHILRYIFFWSAFSTRIRYHLEKERKNTYAKFTFGVCEILLWQFHSEVICLLELNSQFSRLAPRVCHRYENPIDQEVAISCFRSINVFFDETFQKKMKWTDVLRKRRTNKETHVADTPGSCC
jgi:hypothetical protein